MTCALCDNAKIHARGLCGTHYDRWRRWGEKHGEAWAARKHGERVSTILYHARDNCFCLHENGRSASPRCCYGSCWFTLADHELKPPRAGTYHEAVWRWQRRLR